MPTIAVDKEDFYKALGRTYTTSEFDELCFQFGIELDEDTEEGELPIVDGVKERPQLKIEVGANRYDLLCIEGISLALNIFLGNAPVPNYRLSEPRHKLYVKPETKQIRPFVGLAVLRGVKFTERSYKSFISLQDKLHANICRNRTLGAIGTHDLDTVKGPFTYEALPPKEIVFKPLNQNEVMDGERLMEFYGSVKHIAKYLPIIKDSPVYPVIYDANRTVCSLPPIINGDHSKITLDTTNVLIDVTATDRTKCEIVMNQMVAMFSQYCSEPFLIEPCEIIDEATGESHLCPNIAPRTMEASIDYLNSCCGLDLSPEEICSHLSKMSTTATYKGDGVVSVEIPCTRSDILHPCDIMEDLAIGYGYDNLKKTFPNKTSTLGAPLLINKVSDIFRSAAAMSGWHEVMPLTLCSHDENFAFLKRVDDGNTAIQLANPKTLEYQVVRTSLLPGLLKTIRENRYHSLPIRVFEAADVAFKDETRETKSRNERHFAAAYVGKTSGFEIIQGLLTRIMENSRAPRIGCDEKKRGFCIQATDDATYFAGRSADIYFRRDEHSSPKRIGSFGVLHPEVVLNFEIPYAVSCVEISIEDFQ
ncbi:hypothetical protein CANCADRAFT_133023 [Tortispora caseinolytica NRRL Y-17796]|uniref:Phenylalanine--tRNA ligase beta subunit n=1 Tax=Tortispora caseinolytica NRRL Y-17796 TaxID=767744 RepID=A0A1E4TB98_9ASCO|nr:hypothetical protein CANCADRAFT_133023 [Tortispora caseinolytica NRRL Y-17796]